MIGAELNPAHLAFMPIRNADRELQREARLAAATRTRQRHEPLLVEQLTELIELRLATNEARQRNRNVARSHIQRTQRREIDREIGMARLPDAFRTPEAFQAVNAEIPKRQTVNRRIHQKISESHPTPASARRDRSTAQPGAANNRRPEIVLLIAQLRLSCMQGNPHPHWQLRRPQLVSERTLRVERRRDRSRGQREGSHHTVTFTLLEGQDPAMQRHGCMEQLVVPSDHSRRDPSIRFPRPGQAL